MPKVRNEDQVLEDLLNGVHQPSRVKACRTTRGIYNEIPTHICINVQGWKITQTSKRINVQANREYDSKAKHLCLMASSVCHAEGA